MAGWHSQCSIPSLRELSKKEGRPPTEARGAGGDCGAPRVRGRFLRAARGAGMSSPPVVGRTAVVGVEAAPPTQGELWGIVLAGGEGVRLRPLAQRVCGDDRPKQYVPFFGDRTLLRQTLRRVALGIPPTWTAVTTLRSHAGYFRESYGGSGAPHVLVQPADRGTAAGVLFSAHSLVQSSNHVRPSSRSQSSHA